jgi:low temperature requirement protein LtrA
VVSAPTAAARAATSWLILGGTGLYIAGHGAFKAVVWRRVSWPRIAGLVVLALLGLVAPHVSVLILAGCAAVVVVAVAAADYVTADGAGAEADGAGAAEGAREEAAGGAGAAGAGADSALG